jgi:TRAP-type C4-dicarboxylate transport system permease small subunit
MKYIYLSLPVSGVFYTILGINELVSHLVSGKSPQNITGYKSEPPKVKGEIRK